MGQARRAMSGHLVRPLIPAAITLSQRVIQNKVFSMTFEFPVETKPFFQVWFPSFLHLWRQKSSFYMLWSWHTEARRSPGRTVNLGLEKSTETGPDWHWSTLLIPPPRSRLPLWHLPSSSRFALSGGDWMYETEGKHWERERFILLLSDSFRAGLDSPEGHLAWPLLLHHQQSLFVLCDWRE